MNDSGRNVEEAYASPHSSKTLRDKIRETVASENLTDSRNMIKKIAVELKISFLDCAAALAYVHANTALAKNVALEQVKPDTSSKKKSLQPGIRLVRYRLDIGRIHQVNIDLLKKVLVDESGVDVNNIVNLRIQENFSLVDLPDEMPQEIFHHLKHVEINSQKLAIKRLKYRNKRRGQHRFQRVNPHNSGSTQASQEIENR